MQVKVVIVATFEVGADTGGDSDKVAEQF